MKKILLPLLCATTLNIGAVIMPLAADTVQSSWVADVPIMPALMVEKGLGFAFDNPDGLIVTIYLSGDAQAANVQAYYAQALAPLGWSQIGPQRWGRDGEILQLGTTTAAGAQLWKITLRPE